MGLKKLRVLEKIIKTKTPIIKKKIKIIKITIIERKA